MSTPATTSESKVTKVDKVIEFTSGCTFARNADGDLNVTWDNGAAVSAVRGAAVDYVASHFHMCCTLVKDNFVYAPGADLAQLMTGGLSAKMALIIVGFRKIVFSLEAVVLSRTEVNVVASDAAVGKIPEADFEFLRTNATAFKGVLDQTFNILGLNGLSMLNKGHHYTEDDSMWIRLVEAVKFDDMMTVLGITGYEGTLFHDALHPFDISFKAELVTSPTSILWQHCSGVVTKRMPGVPAGTAIIAVSLAALEQLTLSRSEITPLADMIRPQFSQLATQIRANPLDWCSAFQRTTTAANFAQVTRLEPITALIFGMSNEVFGRKSTVMRSMAFKNCAQRHAAMTTVGKEFAETFDIPKYTPEQIITMVASHLGIELPNTHTAAVEN